MVLRLTYGAWLNSTMRALSHIVEETWTHQQPSLGRMPGDGTIGWSDAASNAEASAMEGPLGGGVMSEITVAAAPVASD